MGFTMKEKRKAVAILAPRYRKASKKEKGKIPCEDCYFPTLTSTK
jgi:hypothetical protein